MLVTVELADPEEVLTCDVDARDRRAFEKVGRQVLGLPAALSLPEAVKIAPESYVLWLAHHALLREKADLQPWPIFESRAVSCTQSEEPEEVLGDPTRAAP